MISMCKNEQDICNMNILIMHLNGLCTCMHYHPTCVELV